MRRQQVFVRAQTPSGRWISADALDLDQASFNAFVLDMLRRAGMVASIKDEMVEGAPIQYKTREEVEP